MVHWLLRLVVALPLVTIGCIGLLLHSDALPIDPRAADLLFGFVAFAGVIIWITRKDSSGG
jgi:hypothetical protein